MSLWDGTCAERAVILRRDLDLGRPGLEIGALSHPVLLWSEMDVTYVDFTDGATPRETYRDSPMVSVPAIAEVDAIWGERTLSECLGGRLLHCPAHGRASDHPRLDQLAGERAGSRTRPDRPPPLIRLGSAATGTDARTFGAHR